MRRRSGRGATAAGAALIVAAAIALPATAGTRASEPPAPGGFALAAGTGPTTQPPPAEPAPPPAPARIGLGLRVGGVDVGGLTVPEAARRIRVELEPGLQRPVQVRVGGRSFRLGPVQAGLRMYEWASAERALRRGRGRPVEQLPGAPRPSTLEVGVVLSHSAGRVAGFAARVSRAVGRRARNARFRVTSRRIRIWRERRGRRLSGGSLAPRIRRVLDSPRASRILRARVQATRPGITVARLRRANPAIVTVARRSFRLRLFRGLRYRRSFGIAVGRAGYATPAGRHRVQNKTVNPPWTAPGWAGSLAGRTIPGGAPNNPLKARWLGLGGGYGIHGTGEPWSIGSRASHGCIRMRVRDVKRLYPQVPVGSLVLIV